MTDTASQAPANNPATQIQFSNWRHLNQGAFQSALQSRLEYLFVQLSNQIKESQMAVQADVATLQAAVTTLTTNVGTIVTDIAALLAKQQQAIDAEDLAAIQTANTDMADLNSRLATAIGTIPGGATGT